jgi:DNA topoisomerase-3
MAILSGFSIGTPATRAETIKKLKDVGYVEMKRKSLVCTDLGKMMVETFPVKELFDLEYTGRLEKTLADIERKKFKKEDFMNLIIDFTKKSVEDIKADRVFAGCAKVDEGANVIGTCPGCGSPVIETEKAYGCSNWKNGCKFVVWKDDRYIQSFGKKVSPQMVELLLKNGKVGFHGLVSKKGNKFSAYFLYEMDPKDGTYHWKLEFI